MEGDGCFICADKVGGGSVLHEFEVDVAAPDGEEDVLISSFGGMRKTASDVSVTDASRILQGQYAEHLALYTQYQQFTKIYHLALINSLSPTLRKDIANPDNPDSITMTSQQNHGSHGHTFWNAHFRVHR